ncbi:MAG: hydrogenase maturation protease [Candidatus Nanopelagicales bacterium]
MLVGIGNPDRGDDGAGPMVVREVARRLGPAAAVRVVERARPVDLPDLWRGVACAVVVDAVVGSAVVAVREVAADDADLLLGAGTGSHGLGVADVVALERALGRLPGRVVVVGVPAAAFGHGAAPGPVPTAALADAVAAVLAALATD